MRETKEKKGSKKLIKMEDKKKKQKRNKLIEEWAVTGKSRRVTGVFSHY